MKQRQVSPLVRMWSVMAALVAIAGIIVALARPAWASAEQTHTVTIATTDQKPTELYKETDYTLKKTQISALELLKKAGIEDPGKVQKVKLKEDIGTASRPSASDAATSDADASDATSPDVTSPDDLLIVVQKEAKQADLTIVYGEDEASLKLKLTCAANKPADDAATSVAESKHAVGVSSNDMELLIHVGVDTVNMNGDGFTCLVSEGDQVKAGQPLIRFDRAKIKAAGYSDTVAVLLTNSEDLAGVEIGAK